MKAPPFPLVTHSSRRRGIDALSLAASSRLMFRTGTSVLRLEDLRHALGDAGFVSQVRQTLWS